MPGGRPKNSREVARKVRTIVDKAIDKLGADGIEAAAQMLADEIQEKGLSATLPKFAPFYPKEVHAEVNHRTVEDYVKAKQQQRVGVSDEGDGDEPSSRVH